MIDPQKLALARQRLYIPVTQFSGLEIAAPTITIAGGEAGTVAIGISSDANAAALSKTAATNRTGITGVQPPPYQSAGAGNPVLTEIGTTGVMAGLMAAAGNDFRHFMPIPTDWDRRHPIYPRVHWSSEAAAVGARDITWKFMYKLFAPGSGVIAAPDVVLDTVIAVQAPAGTAKTYERTAAGVLKANKLVAAAVAMAFIVEMDAFNGAFTENKYLLGIEFEYTPRWGNSRAPGPEAGKWLP
jgi:hypothetical protein